MELFVLVTEGQLTFGQRSISDTEDICKSSSKSSQPPDIKKIFAVLMSVLMFSATPASAMPRIQRIQRDVHIWERDLEEVVSNPCNYAKNLQHIQPSPDLNFTLHILDFIKSSSVTSRNEATEIINRTLSRVCREQSFDDLVAHSRDTISKTADRKPAMEEMYRVLSTYTAHVIYVMKDATNARMEFDCEHEPGVEYYPNRDNLLNNLISALLNTMCSTTRIENLSGLNLRFVPPTAETLAAITSMKRDCSQRQSGDCHVVKSIEEFLAHYFDYYESLHQVYKQKSVQDQA